jgi:hypothetical protein
MVHWLALGFLAVTAALVCAGIGYVIRGWWLRKRGGRSSDNSARVTVIGLVFIGFVVLATFAGLGAPSIAPDSELAHWIRSNGVVAYLLACLAVFTVIGTVLEIFGYRLYGASKNKHDAV